SFSRDWSSDVCSSDLLTSGLVFMPLALGFSVTASWAGRLVPARGAKLILLGSILLLLGYVALFLGAKLLESNNNLVGLILGALRSEERRVGRESGCTA